VHTDAEEESARPAHGRGTGREPPRGEGVRGPVLQAQPHRPEGPRRVGSAGGGVSPAWPTVP
jgi:hypothetical protein